MKIKKEIAQLEADLIRISGLKGSAPYTAPTEKAGRPLKESDQFLPREGLYPSGNRMKVRKAHSNPSKRIPSPAPVMAAPSGIVRIFLDGVMQADGSPSRIEGWLIGRPSPEDKEKFNAVFQKIGMKKDEHSNNGNTVWVADKGTRKIGLTKLFLASLPAGYFIDFVNAPYEYALYPVATAPKWVRDMQTTPGTKVVAFKAGKGIPMEDGLEYYRADEMAETLAYDQFLSPEEDKELYRLLWRLSEGATNKTPLGGDGSDGTVEDPSGQIGDFDDQGKAIWSKIPPKFQEALNKAYMKDHGDFYKELLKFDSSLKAGEVENGFGGVFDKKVFKVIMGYHNDPGLLGKFDSYISRDGNHNPSGTMKIIPAGTLIEYETTSSNGSVWFYLLDDALTRGARFKVESGSINNMLNAGVVDFVKSIKASVEISAVSRSSSPEASIAYAADDALNITDAFSSAGSAFFSKVEKKGDTLVCTIQGSSLVEHDGDIASIHSQVSALSKSGGATEVEHEGKKYTVTLVSVSAGKFSTEPKERDWDDKSDDQGDGDYYVNVTGTAVLRIEGLTSKKTSPKKGSTVVSSVKASSGDGIKWLPGSAGGSPKVFCYGDGTPIKAGDQVKFTTTSGHQFNIRPGTGTEESNHPAAMYGQLLVKSDKPIEMRGRSTDVVTIHFEWSGKKDGEGNLIMVADRKSETGDWIGISKINASKDGDRERLDKALKSSPLKATAKYVNVADKSQLDIGTRVIFPLTGQEGEVVDMMSDADDKIAVTLDGEGEETVFNLKEIGITGSRIRGARRIKDIVKSRSVPRGTLLTAGATSISTTFEVDYDAEDVKIAFNHLKVEDRERYGSNAYSGSWATIDAVKVDSTTVFESYKEALEECLNKAEKWDYAWAVRYKEGGVTEWLMAGWAAE